MGPALKALRDEVVAAVDARLANAMHDFTGPGSRLADAMSYSLTNGGKRIRPLLVYAAARALGPCQHLDWPAAAVEAIHAYSLVHDDLPAMDNDDLRRGKPTTHIAFDEASAILAGDGLQTLAFELLAQAPFSTEQRMAFVTTLARASGARGMVLGQAIDLEAVNRQLTLEQLERMHRHKTGALIAAAVELGAVAAGATDAQRQALADYAAAIGLAFQVQDDILDVTSDTATLGKPQGADQALNKPTYVSLLGLEGAQSKVACLHRDAIAALQCFGEGANPLRELADYIVNRRH